MLQVTVALSFTTDRGTARYISTTPCYSLFMIVSFSLMFSAPLETYCENLDLCFIAA